MAESEDKKKDSGPKWDNEILFTQLILSFQAAGWQQLGKVPSVMTGKIERSLEMAKHSIDMLGMLEAKTKGNLTPDEARFLQHTLFELRMNYLDELKKGPDQAPNEAPKEEEPSAGGDTEKKE